MRKSMDIKWDEHVTEEEVRRRSGQQSVIDKLSTHRWRYYGHFLKMGQESSQNKYCPGYPKAVDAVADQKRPGAKPSSKT